MEESKKVNTEHFKKKIGNTTYRVRVHFPLGILRKMHSYPISGKSAFSAEYQADFYGQREYADYE